MKNKNIFEIYNKLYKNILFVKIRSKIRSFDDKIHSILMIKQRKINKIYNILQFFQGNIPHNVYQTWKEPVLYFRHAKQLEKFRKLNYDYNYLFFDDAGISEYMKRYYKGNPILDIFNSIDIPASKVDIWRYCILYREGGIYCDIDSMVSIPFRDLLKNNPREIISFESNLLSDLLEIGKYADNKIFLEKPSIDVAMKLQYPEHPILNWLLIFEPQNEILKETINLIIEHFDFYSKQKFDSVWKAIIHATGPIALTQAVWRWIQNTGKCPIQKGIDFDGFGIFKIDGSNKTYDVSPHYTELRKRSICS
jgi:mannosyltransferase OCH1-like enzyme